MPLQEKQSLHDVNRKLDGPLLVFDLPLLTEKIKQEDIWYTSDRNAVTLFKSENLSLVLIALRVGAEIDFRRSENIICLQLLGGKIELQATNETILLEQGHLLTLHENRPHNLLAIRETVLLLSVANRMLTRV